MLEAIKHRATHAGVAVDARIERGRTYRHALRELLAHEQQDRIVVAADASGADGFDAADIAWLLEHAPVRSSCSAPVTTASSARRPTRTNPTARVSA